MADIKAFKGLRYTENAGKITQISKYKLLF